MLENLQAKNPNIEVLSVFSEKYKKFGRVLTMPDAIRDEIIEAAEKMPVPDWVSYTAENDEFKSLAASEYIKNKLFGTLPTQVGYCCGHNSLLNATEWHTSSEINIAVTPLVLILGHRWDIENGKINSSKFKAFYLPKGTVTEVYATTLHYTPCQTADSGFGCIVALPEGTNTPLDTESNDKLLTAKNKWLLAHTENAAKIKQGAYTGIMGKNINIHY